MLSAGLERVLENHRSEPVADPAKGTGVPQRAYVQLLLLGAMVPLELAAMVRWSAPAGALLLGGTVAAGVTSAAGPRVWAHIMGTAAKKDTQSHTAGAPGTGRVTIRLSPATKSSRQHALRAETIQAALHRVCHAEDVVTTSAGDFIVELQMWKTMDSEAIGRRIALAVENRLDVKLSVHVESRHRADPASAVEALQSPLREACDEIFDGYSLRRDIFGGEPQAFASSGGDLFKRARARLQAFAPVAV